MGDRRTQEEHTRPAPATQPSWARWYGLGAGRGSWRAHLYAEARQRVKRAFDAGNWMGSDDLIRLTAVEAVRLLRAGDVSPAELLDAAEGRIAAIDGRVNALPTLCFDRARRRAGHLSFDGERPDAWLAGLPIAVKDLNDVAGVRTTYGSKTFAGNVPERSDIMVECLEANGALVVAKSNTPEWGAGANTFNEVFGPTRNPWNTSLTCGGSSGGSAVALATGEVWLATGSDLAGSLRTPASFCSVVGLRPSPGRVAAGPSPLPFDTLGVEGPMGRTVADAALMLDAMVGASPKDPLSIEAPATSFLSTAEAAAPPARVGFSPDLGIGPVDGEVRDICESAARRFGDLGAVVEDASPDFSEAPEAFRVLRGEAYAAGLGDLYRHAREDMKPDIVWNVELGLALSLEDVRRAEEMRGRIVANTAAFFATHDVLACPAACMPPFDVELTSPRELDGVAFDSYVEWLRITYAITLTSCPAISVPCGFTRDRRPVGLQLVAPPRGEAALLGAAAAFERAVGIAGRVPIDPVVPVGSGRTR